MSKHTPKPWVVCDGPRSLQIHSGEHWIATMKCGSCPAREEEYARLIAAAPDLLEALKNLLAYLEDGIGDHDSGEGAAARGAIAKAEGKDDASC